MAHLAQQRNASVRVAADHLYGRRGRGGFLLEGGVDPALGVRPLRAKIESVVEAFVADCILDGRLQPGAIATISVVDRKLILQQPTPQADCVSQ